MPSSAGSRTSRKRRRQEEIEERLTRRRMDKKDLRDLIDTGKQIGVLPLQLSDRVRQQKRRLEETTTEADSCDSKRQRLPRLSFAADIFGTHQLQGPPPPQANVSTGESLQSRSVHPSQQPFTLHENQC